MLLAAAVAPTDPVLATEVQVAEPTDEPEKLDDEARFTLTSEAGLNDGLAFPFVYVAIAISLVGPAPSDWFAHWFALDVVWRLSAGVLGGLAVGWMLRKLFFGTRSSKIRLAHAAEGFVALAATFLAYGFTELINGYGFVAVFVCACTIRAGERSHSYHQVLHQYIEQLERLLTVGILILLGGAATTGLLAGVGWQRRGGRGRHHRDHPSGLRLDRPGARQDRTDANVASSPSSACAESGRCSTSPTRCRRVTSSSRTPCGGSSASSSSPRS